MLRTYRMIWEILTPPERRRAVLLLVMTIFMAIFEVIGVAVILPFMQVLADPEIVQTNGALRWLWQTFGFTSTQSFAIALGIGAFVIIVVSMAVRAVTTYALIRFAMMRVYAISSRLLHSYLYQPYSWFLMKNSASLGQTLLYETDKAIHECLQPALLLIANLLVTVLIAAFVFVVEPYVAVGAVALLATVYALVYLGFRRLLDRFGAERLRANGDRFKTVQEATGGIKDVKVQGLEERFLGRYREPALRLARYETLSQTIGRLPRFALEAVVYGGFILMVLLMLIEHGGDIGDLLPLFGLIGMAGTKLFPALQQVYVLSSAMRYMTPALEALHRNLTTLQPPVQPDPTARPLRLTKSLELLNVRFRYPGTEQDTLDGLSAVIPARTTIGIVGGTGAGKTTLIDIVLGLFVPSAGEIVVDGTPIRANSVVGWQKNVGYVPQHIFLSDDTVAANIAFGLTHDEIDMQAVERAARVANLHDFVVSELQLGYDTVVGERGIRLSGGQRQRIGIARALYNNPDVLVLDEATSALDNLTERAVMDAVHNLGGEKTILMIAHRLSTVKSCDRIFLLDRGRVVAEGTYDELVAGNAMFRKMAAHDG